MFVETMGILMDVLGMGECVWPAKKIKEWVNSLDKHITDDSVKLDTNMFQMMTRIIESFKYTFPNVTSFTLDINWEYGISSQFSTKFIEVYFDQLQVLHHNNYVPLDLPFFPPNLTSLAYSCDTFAFPTMPAFNPIPLKELKLNMVPNDFSWEQHCGSLVLPNLNNLKVAFLTSEEQRDRNKAATNLGIVLNKPSYIKEQLDLPNLKSIDLNCSHNNSAHCLVKNNGKHLDKFSYSGSIKNLYSLDVTLFKSIKSINVHLEGKIDNVYKFYKHTNNIFGTSMQDDGSSCLQYNCEELEIDYKKVYWPNINTLKIDYIRSDSLVYALIQMPNIKNIEIGRLKLQNKNSQLKSLAGSKLKRITIHCRAF